jgi:hypothetical protein
LPTDLSEFPILFTEKELKFLKGTNTLILIKNKLAILKDIYQHLKTSFPDHFTLSEEIFLQGNLLYESRGFSINDSAVKEQERTQPDIHCLIPMGDMLNHTSEKDINMRYTFDF